MIEDIKVWCYKVLPLVYDDSLSYYEVVCKVAEKINEIIPIVNITDEKIRSEVDKQLQAMITDGTFNDIINTQIFGELNEKVNNNTTSIGNLNAEINDVKTKTNLNSTDITLIKSNITQLTNSVNEITPKLDNIEAKVETLNSNVNSAIKDLIKNGILIPSSMKIKKVGTTEYPTIVDVTNSIEDGDVTMIVLPAGNYNFSALYPATTYQNGYLFPDNTFIVGEGNAYSAHITASFSEMNNNYSTINCKGNFALINVNIESYNCRYAIHDDYPYKGECTRLFKHIVLSNFNCYFHAVGGSVGNEHKVIYDDCVMRCNGNNAQSAFYYHNANNDPGIGYITVKNTMLFTSCADETTTFADAGFDIAFENSNDISVSFEGCSAHSMFTTNTDKGRIELHMDTDIPIKNGYFYDRCTAPRFERLGLRAGLTFSKGKMITLSKDMKINNTATAYTFFGVIAMLDNVSAVVVKSGSTTSLAELNVSGEVSGDWEYLYLQSDLTLGLTSGAYVMGVAYHDGTARLFDYCYPKP